MIGRGGGRAQSLVGEGFMRRILVLLMVVAMGCGVAAALTVVNAPNHAVTVEGGY